VRNREEHHRIEWNRKKKNIVRCNNEMLQSSGTMPLILPNRVPFYPATMATGAM
jgi:hypothetical protein